LSSMCPEPVEGHDADASTSSADIKTDVVETRQSAWTRTIA
jgi:hypothetical protein